MSVSVKAAVGCSCCDASYHPSCFLRVAGAYVDLSGDLVCCNALIRSCQECGDRDVEIAKLKMRLSKINKKCLDVSLADLSQSTTEAVRTQDDTRFEILMEYMCNMRSELIANIDSLSSSLDELKCNFATGYESVNGLVCDDIVLNAPITGEARTPKILLLSDSHGRQCSSILSDAVGSGWEVFGLVKPGACFEAVVEDVAELTKNFDEFDYVIVLAGANNVLINRHLSKAFLRRLQNSLKHTNLVLVSVPFFNKNDNYNRAAYQLNCTLHQLTEHSGTTHYVEVNSLITGDMMTRHGLHMKLAAKKIVMSYVCCQINALNVTSRRCLINIPLIDDDVVFDPEDTIHTHLEETNTFLE